MIRTRSIMTKIPMYGGGKWIKKDRPKRQRQVSKNRNGSRVEAFLSICKLDKEIALD